MNDPIADICSVVVALAAVAQAAFVALPSKKMSPREFIHARGE
jgi:hypothetical protein